MNAVIECMPHLIAATTSIVKILNVHFNRENVRELYNDKSFWTKACCKVVKTNAMLQFKKLFDFMTEQWEELKLTDDLHVLEDVTMRGSKMAQLYRSKLLCFKLLIEFPFLFFHTSERGFVLLVFSYITNYQL